jgi:hypothetical protein
MWPINARPSAGFPAAELEGCAASVGFEHLDMQLGAVMAACTLEGGIQPVAAIVHRPDREPIGYRARG